MTVPPVGARKLALDEESFQQLLAAAYALQENKDVLQAGNSEQGSAAVFSEIAALRSQILAQVDTMSPDGVNPKKAKPKPAAEAAALVADSLRGLTKADGASVCLIVDGYLRPTACSGATVKVSGGSVASNSLVATERLRNGRAFQSANACSDIRLAPAVCADLEIGSLLAFPLERQNEVAGIVEVRWTKADAFSDGDERICQLMAELMSEVLETEAGQVNASVLLAPDSAGSEMIKLPLPTIRPAPLDVVDGNACRVCGRPLTANESFCANCRMLTAATDNSLQGKWASMWFMQQAQKTAETGHSHGERRWPLHEVKAASAAARSSHIKDERRDEEIPEETEALANGKRTPRSVLSVLKARFRSRAMGQ